MPDDVPTLERVRAALDEVLGWQGISRSPQLADLLRYVVEKTLAGNAGTIKAYSIAVDVFGRPTDFDPQSDPIVRVQARRLRSLLEQFYSSGLGRSGVQIELPLGRYVPEFRSVAEGRPAAAAASEPPRAPGRRWSSRRRFFANAGLALAFTVVGVMLAVALVRWMLPQTRVTTAIPDVPGIEVGAFDNLTGDPALDGEAAQLGQRVDAALKRFVLLRVGPGESQLHGTVQLQSGAFVVRATLDGPSGEMDWTATIAAQPGVAGPAALKAAGEMLAARLGQPGGPLHKRAKDWLALQKALPEPPTTYLCSLVHMGWRESRRIEDADRTAGCFAKVLTAAPDDAIALAAWADVSSWQARYRIVPGDDIIAANGQATDAAARAVSLLPASAFVYQQQALVLGRQGSVSAALGSAAKAMELNSASMDAVAIYGLLLFMDGQYEAGSKYAEQALTTITPPAWYYLVRALNAVREERFFDAIDAAQALPGGDELGPIIALSSAPRAARTDLIDRYRPQVLGNPRFQQSGIMPRIATQVSADGVLRRIRAGLVLAGLPTNTLDAPFNADGSPVGPRS